jgi:hypothetical protein
MDWLNKKKGFVYIITTVIIVLFITTLFLLTRAQPNNYTYSQNLAQNYKFELSKLVNNDLTVTDVNNFNNSFYHFIRAHNYNTKMCVLINKNNNIYASNFLGVNDINLNGTNVNDKNTVMIPRPETDIIFSNCELDYNSNNNYSYYIEIYNNTEKAIYKNK